MKTEELKELIKRSGWEISALGYIHAGTNAVTFNELQRIVADIENQYEECIANRMESYLTSIGSPASFASDVGDAIRKLDMLLPPS